MGIFGRKQSPSQSPLAIEERPAPNPDPVFGELNPELFAPLPQKRGLFGGGLGKALGTVAGVAMMGPAYFAFQQGRKDGAARRAGEMEDAEVNRRYKEALIAQSANPETFEDDIDPETGQLRGQRNLRTREYKPVRDGVNAPAFLQEADALGIPREDAIAIWKQRYSRPEPVVQVAGPQGPMYVSRTDAIGKPAYVKPPASRSGGSATKAQATRVVGGKAYYKVNGAWYDNPEGR